MFEVVFKSIKLMHHHTIVFISPLCIVNGLRFSRSRTLARWHRRLLWRGLLAWHYEGSAASGIPQACHGAIAAGLLRISRSSALAACLSSVFIFFFFFFVFIHFFEMGRACCRCMFSTQPEAQSQGCTSSPQAA